MSYPKKIGRVEFDTTLGLYTVSFSDRYINPALPEAIAGLDKMEGHIATFYSGTLAASDGRQLVGKLDVFREEMLVGQGQMGRYKKYSYTIHIPNDVASSGPVVVVREVPKDKIANHHSTDMEEEFYIQYVNGPFGTGRKT